MSIRIACLTATLVTACASSVAMAQQLAPIDRVKITDNQLNCAQIYGEVGDMDKAIATAQAAADSGSSTAMAGNAANVAAEVASRTGLFGQIGGIGGALFGRAAAQTAAGAVQQSGQQTAQQSAERIKQATARKEYLTSMFIARGCRASDLNYNPPVAAPAAAPVQQAAPAALPAEPAAPAAPQ